MFTVFTTFGERSPGEVRKDMMAGLKKTVKVLNRTHLWEWHHGT